MAVQSLAGIVRGGFSNDADINALIGQAGLQDNFSSAGLSDPRQTIQPVTPAQARSDSSTPAPAQGYSNGYSLAGNGAVSQILTSPEKATTPATDPSQPNWNSLKIGQTLNKGTVLDANVFNSEFVKNLSQGGSLSIDGDNTFITAANDPHKLAATLGKDVGDDANVHLANFQAQNFVISHAQRTGFTGEQADSGSGTDVYDTAAIESNAAKLGIDTSKYKIAGSSYQDDLGNEIKGDDTLDYKRLGDDINKANFTKAASDPNALWIVDSQKVGADSHLQRNATAYVQRGDRLIPVQSNDYKKDSELQDVWTGVKPLVGIALSAFLGPEVAAYFGGGVGGAAAAGAVTGGASAAIQGQNVLTGALAGGVSGGAGSFAGSAVSGATDSALAGKVASGVVGGISSAAIKGGDVGTAALMGVINGTAGAVGKGLGFTDDPTTASFLSQIIKTGAGYALNNSTGKPQR